MSHYLDDLVNFPVLNGALVTMLQSDKERTKICLLHGVASKDDMQSGVMKYHEGKVFSVPSKCVKECVHDEKENIPPRQSPHSSKRARSRSPRGKSICLTENVLVNTDPKDYVSIVNTPTNEIVDSLVLRGKEKRVFRTSIMIKHEAEMNGEMHQFNFMIFLVSDEKSAMQQLYTAAATFGISTGDDRRLEEHIDNLPASTSEKVPSFYTTS